MISGMLPTFPFPDVLAIFPDVLDSRLDFVGLRLGVVGLRSLQPAVKQVQLE